MTTTAILTACLEHLDTFVYVFPSGEPELVLLPPGVQGADGEPPDEGFWLESKLFPNENTDPAWNDDSCARVRGFFQVAVYWRVRDNPGLIVPSTVADAVVAHFPKGTELGSVRVRKQPHQSPVVHEDDRSFIPVTVPYQGAM